MPSPPPTLELTVSLSAPGKLEHAFLNAGFRAPSVNVSPVPVRRDFQDVDDTLGRDAEVLLDASRVEDPLLRRVPDDDRVADELEEVLVGRHDAYVF